MSGGFSAMITSKKYKILRFFIRFFIVSMWTLLILVFLYLPQSSWWNSFDRSLNVLVWPQIVDTDVLLDFEKKMGVTVNVSYFESNDELFAKLSGSKTHGYDIIMFSDFFLATLVKSNFVKPVDWSRITFKDDLYSQLLDRPCDPSNTYTIPCFWAVFGIGIDINVFNGILPLASWKILFDAAHGPAEVGMVEDMLQCFSAAAMYKYGRITNLTVDEIDAVTQVLIEQKKRVVAYTDMRIEYLLASGSCGAVFASSADVAKMAKRYPNIHFLAPEEGSFSELEYFGIAANSTKDDLIYAFLNYIYRPEIMQQFIETFEFPSPLKSLSVPYALPEATFLSPYADKWQSFSKMLNPQIMEKIWLAVKTT
jgi:spermidine/putrescine transport system substrate-binding protein